MSKGFEQELSLAEKAQLQTHLAVCRTCVFCLNQIKSLQTVLSHYIDAFCDLAIPSRYHLASKRKKEMQHALDQAIK